MRNYSLTVRQHRRKVGRDCISLIMMGVSSSDFSAVILNADALAAPTAEIFNTVNLGVENGGPHLINHNLYHDCSYIKNCRHLIHFLNSGACHGKEVADFPQKGD